MLWHFSFASPPFFFVALVVSIGNSRANFTGQRENTYKFEMYEKLKV